MARRPGRPDDAQHARRGRILGALTLRGELGLTRRRLETAVGLNGPGARRMLMRDLSSLRTSGWDIRSLKRNGEDVYVLRVVDPRLRRRFTSEERAQLLRAAQRAGLGQLYDDLDPTLSERTPAPADPRMAVTQEAIAMRCLLMFLYNGKPRALHPYDLGQTPKGWLLRGREVVGVDVKSFYVASMSAVCADLPGTAEAIPDDLQPLSLDPMNWLVHDPITVQLTCDQAQVDDVVAMLGRSRCRVTDGNHSAMVELDVTHTNAFLSRLFELGHRAVLAGPPQMRNAARVHLQEVVEANQ